MSYSCKLTQWLQKTKTITYINCEVQCSYFVRSFNSKDNTNNTRVRVDLYENNGAIQIQAYL